MTTSTAAPSRVRSNDALYGEVLDWLIDEAALLDRGRLTEWLQLLTHDISYRVPVREIRSRFADAPPSDSGYFHYDENRASLEARVLRIAEPTAWAEDPATPTRHLVSNLRVNRLPSGELLAESYLLLVRQRRHQPNAELLSAERRDVFRRSDDGRLLLARRDVEVDRSSLGMVNLAVFL